VKKFRRLKEEHHKYYKYIHELSEEHDSIEDQMRNINRWILKHKAANKRKKDREKAILKNKKKKEIKAYKEKIKQNEYRFNKLQKKRQKIMKIT